QIYGGHVRHFAAVKIGRSIEAIGHRVDAQVVCNESALLEGRREAKRDTRRWCCAWVCAGAIDGVIVDIGNAATADGNRATAADHHHLVILGYVVAKSIRTPLLSCVGQ